MPEVPATPALIVNPSLPAAARMVIELNAGRKLCGIRIRAYAGAVDRPAACIRQRKRTGTGRVHHRSADIVCRNTIGAAPPAGIGRTDILECCPFALKQAVTYVCRKHSRGRG